MIRIQPDEAIYLKVSNKVPGLGLRIDTTRLDLTYKARYAAQLPGEWEQLPHALFQPQPLPRCGSLAMSDAALEGALHLPALHSRLHGFAPDAVRLLPRNGCALLYTDAYERLILDAINGDRRLFIRADELEVAWQKFTPLLQARASATAHLLARRRCVGSRGAQP